MSIKLSPQSDNFDILPYISKHRAQLFTAAAVAVMSFCALIGSASGLSAAVKQVYSVSEKSEVPVLSESILTKETPDTPDKPKPSSKPEPTETKDKPEPEKLVQTEKKQTEVQPKPPEKHTIKKVGHIVQYDKLITGCELISANVVLNYYGKNVDHEKIIKHTKFGKIHVAKDGKWYGPSPYKAFLGDPHRLDGMGCFAPVIVDMVNDFGYTDLCASDTTGTPLCELADKYVANDIPVMIWVTDSMGPTGKGDVWHLEYNDGSISKKTFTWPLNEHCVVLMGYDKNNYYLSDPLSYSDCVKYDRKLVEARFKDLGYMSVVIEKTEVDTESDNTSKNTEKKSNTTDSESKSEKNTKTTDSESKIEKNTKATDSESKSENKTKTTDSESKSENKTKTTDSESKSENKTKTTDSESKIEKNTKATDSESKSENKTKTTDIESKSEKKTKATDSESKSEKNTKATDSESKSEKNTKATDSELKSEKKTGTTDTDKKTQSGEKSKTASSKSKSEKAVGAASEKT